MNWRTITAVRAKRLKKRSAANLPSQKRPEELIYFLDRQLRRYKMVAVLRSARGPGEVNDDHFRQDALDPEWLTAVGEKNWIVVTRDELIRYRVAEKQAIRRANVRAFVLAAQGDLGADMLAENFLKALPKIRPIVEKQK